MAHTEEYRTVTVTLQQLRLNSLMVTVPKMQGWHPLARSLIHGADEIRLKNHYDCPCEITLRIVAWKADELHLS